MFWRSLKKKIEILKPWTTNATLVRRPSENHKTWGSFSLRLYAFNTNVIEHNRLIVQKIKRILYRKILYNRLLRVLWQTQKKTEIFKTTNSQYFRDWFLGGKDQLMQRALILLNLFSHQAVRCNKNLLLKTLKMHFLR